VDLLRRAWSLDADGAGPGIDAGVRAALVALALDPEPLAPYLLALLGSRAAVAALEPLSPEAIRTRTFDALQRVLRAQACPGPLVLLIEDLHWIDRTSEAFLGAVLDALPAAAVLVVVTARPGYEPPWLARSFASQLALPPLDGADGQAVVRSILVGADSSERSMAQILTRAEGNPFFLEELAWAVASQSTAADPQPVPVTITAALTARMDRLPAEPRRVLATAAVLGREVRLPLLEAVTATPRDRLAAPLRQLVAGEFLYEQPGPTFIFKHALTQDVACSRLPDAERRRLHSAAGRALESLYANRVDEAIDRLACHWAQTDDHERAIEWLGRFAQVSVRAYALTEAVAALREALEHAEKLPVGRARDEAVVELASRHAFPLAMLGRYADALHLLQLHGAAAARLGDDPRLPRYFMTLAHSHAHLGHRELAVAAAQRALREAQRWADESALGCTHYVLTLESFWRADFVAGGNHSENAIAILRRTPERFILGHASWGQGLNAVARGDFVEAARASTFTRSVGEESGDARLESFGLWLAGWVSTLMGDDGAAIEQCRLALQRARDPLNESIAAQWLGFALLEAGRPGDAEPLLSRAVEQYERFQFTELQGWGSAWLAHATLKAGRPDEARRLAERAAQLCQSVGFEYGRGLALRAAAHSAESLSRGRVALEIVLHLFTRIGAHYEVARTHAELATTAHAAGDSTGARMHLTSSHRLFADLDVPLWVARTVDIGRRCGIGLGDSPLASSTAADA
jgi:tetratricopeptide (TPR) repeat protein